MQDGLSHNHTVLGLHMGGNNHLDVDAKGNLSAIPNEDPACAHIMTRVCPNVNEKKVVSEGIVDLQVTSNCWLCEGWSQMIFKFNPFDLE